MFKDLGTKDSLDSDGENVVISPMQSLDISNRSVDTGNNTTNIDKDYRTTFHSGVSIERAEMWSWVVNWFLLVAKTYIAIVSNSKAVWASLADSIVDLLSQAVLSLASRYIKRHDPDYPVGKSRLEALSVLASAGIMTMASIEVIQFACLDLMNGFEGRIPRLDVDGGMYAILAVGILLKVVLYIYCTYANKIAESDSMEALAEDHLNDVRTSIRLFA